MTNEADERSGCGSEEEEVEAEERGKTQVHTFDKAFIRVVGLSKSSLMPPVRVY